MCCFDLCVFGLGCIVELCCGFGRYDFVDCWLFWFVYDGCVGVE